MSESVVVLGGGVAGLTAAHELVERGFDVDVYEKREILGGKARSVGVPETGTEETEPLPGEHGFRFFPSFYNHTFDTLERIPYDGNPNGVFDNLVETQTWMMARPQNSEIELPLEIPDSIEEWKSVFDIFIGDALGIPDDESRHFASRILTFLTSCEERRRNEYEETSWWDFTDAKEMSEAYRRFHARGLTRALVAMRAEEASTRTIGKIYVQFLLGLMKPRERVDSLLDGPTNEVWIDPWVEFLEGKGVEFHTSSKVESLIVGDNDLEGVELSTDAGSETVTGDYYVAALPVEVMAELVDDELAREAPQLQDIDALDTAWMNGMQFYFDEPLEVNEGHVILSGSPWALTLVTQAQFWDEFDLSNYGDGSLRDILSICISNWEKDGELYDKPAKECTREELEEEVWHQIDTRLNDGEDSRFDRQDVIRSFLDPDIEFDNDKEVETNAEPLLLNTTGSLQYRPEASTAISNLFLASDYVRTFTDLASMEAANEAARRAVNEIISRSGVDADRCEIFPLEEPDVFEPFKKLDRLQWELGRSHQYGD